MAESSQISTAREADILNAAEVLLASGPGYSTYSNRLSHNSDDLQSLERQLSSTHNSLSSLENAYCEEVSSGARQNGRMSVVRRFFCLFVLFDLLLVSLIWLICLMLMGSDNLIQTLKMQVVYYKITTSLFDVVLAAFCRFTALLLFYGLLELSTTFFVALSTLGTCVFLIFKVVYYSWSTASQPAFQVILIIISFIVVWSETWFLDFRVLPKERAALNYVNYVQWSDQYSDFLRTLLLSRHQPLSGHFPRGMTSQIRGVNEPIGDFYTPLGSSSSSGDEDDAPRIISKHPGTGYIRRGKDTLELAWSILNDCDWKLEKTTPEGDYVYSKSEPQLGKVFLLRTTINMPARRLLDELFMNVDKFHVWNLNVKESRRIRVIDEHTDITYQVSSGSGIISPRDFVVLRHWDMKGDSYVLAGISIPYPNVALKKEYIRGENGPCCWVMRPQGADSCLFEFLLNTNLKGWIPQRVLDAALTSVLLGYSSSLKAYCLTYR